MKKLISWLQILYSPTFIGFYLTLAIVFIAFNFYTAGSMSAKGDSAIIDIIRIAHQKSIDLRLQMRGWRSGTPEVALLVVDERSLETVGRWPWPREKVAAALSKAFDYGAKMIASDIAFSEPSAKPAEELFQQVQKTTPIPTALQSTFTAALNQLDSDRIMAETIAKYANRFVMGHFFEAVHTGLSRARHENACHNLIFEQSEAYRIWQKEEVILSVTDPFDFYIPDMLAETYKGHLNQIEEEIRRSVKPPRNRLEQVELENRINEAKMQYCYVWLDPQNDELFDPISDTWDVIKQHDDDLKTNSFDEWAAEFRQKFLQNPVIVADNWTMNTAQISSGAKHSGYFNAQQDKDGTIRRSRIVVRTGNHYMPSIALKGFLVANNYNAEITFEADPHNEIAKRVKTVKITSNDSGDEVFSIPVDEEGNMTINYAGPRNMFAYASLGDLLSDDEEIYVEQRVYNKKTKDFELKKFKEKKATFFKDRLFILGASAMGIYDLRVTPFDENFPGAETHANILDNLLRRDFLRTHADEELTMLVVLVGGGLLLSLALAHLGALPGMLLTASLLIGVSYVDRYYFFGNGIVVSIVFPLLMIVVLYVGLTFYKYMTEERNKREIRKTFQKYVSPAIVDEILKHPDNLELGGRKARITVFFSDVRGFTTISEKLDPRALSDLLNSYLTPMTDLVFKNRGTLDKYMGDAIMAFFGAPVPYKDHAKFACRCALEHLSKLKELQDQYKKKGLPSIDIGIGLNTGECSVGNMGSQSVRNYTVMGDAVNLASRLEGINKQYGTRIIISEFTYEDVKNDFICREIDWVRVKGKALPVKIYELVAEGKASASDFEVLKNFNEGYLLYHQRKFSQGIELFTRALNLNPEDAPSRLYLERCQSFVEAPPPEDWDGVFVMKTK